MNWQVFIKWTNENSGFLSLLLFVATILFGWMSGLFNSLIKKPKLKIRFIEKASFYCFFETGNKYYNAELKENFDLHQTAFAVYMSIANIGNMATSIDKVYLGYYRNSTRRKLFDKQLNWLAQRHIFDDFKLEYRDKVILIPPLRVRTEYFAHSPDDRLEVGKSITGIAYFEQEEAWGNFNPKTIDNNGTIKVIIRIRDIYGKHFYFRTKLNPKSLEEARKINSTFGSTSKHVG